MKIRSTVAAGMLVVSIMVLAMSSTYAQDYHKGGKNYPEGIQKNKERLLDELNLTAQQKEQLKEIMKENRGSAVALREQLQASRKALKGELNKVESDTAKINILVTELKNIEGQVVDERVRHILKIKTILTPEQFNKFKEKMESGKNKRMQMMKEKFKVYKNRKAGDCQWPQDR